MINQLGKIHSSLGGRFCTDLDYRMFVRLGGDRLIELWVARPEYERSSFRYGHKQGLFDVINYFGADTAQLMRRFGKVIEVRPGEFDLF